MSQADRDRLLYLSRFLHGCANAADRGELGVDHGRLLVNGDLMREAANALVENLPEETA